MNNSSYLFGPIRSRRLGLSLGIELLPSKVCNLNCIYCECGKTTTLTSKRAEYVPSEVIINELDEYLKDNPPLDVITFAGSGEPTLNSGVPKIIAHIRANYPQYKLCILTNSLLLIDPAVREEIMELEYVLPSLDAMTDESYNKINRAGKTSLCSDVLEGLELFAKEYRGNLWVELFVVPGVNDSDIELNLFKSYFEKIKPTRIQLNSLDRPGTVNSVPQPTPTDMERVLNKLLPLPVEIVSRNALPATMPIQVLSLEKLLHTVERRPQTVEDIATLFGVSINDANALAEKLIEDKKASFKEINGQFFLKRI